VKRGERGYKTPLSHLPPPQTLTHFLLLTCPAPPFPNPRSEKLLLFSHGCGALLFGTKPTLQPPRHHWSNSRKNPLSAPSSPPQEFTLTASPWPSMSEFKQPIWRKHPFPPYKAWLSGLFFYLTPKWMPTTDRSAVGSSPGVSHSLKAPHRRRRVACTRRYGWIVCYLLGWFG